MKVLWLLWELVLTVKPTVGAKERNWENMQIQIQGQMGIKLGSKGFLITVVPKEAYQHIVMDRHSCIIKISYLLNTGLLHCLYVQHLFLCLRRMSISSTFQKQFTFLLKWGTVPLLTSKFSCSHLLPVPIPQTHSGQKSHNFCWFWTSPKAFDQSNVISF